MNMLIHNIKGLVQVAEETIPKKAGTELNHLNTIENAFLYIKGGKIEDFGPMDQCPLVIAKKIDATGKFVFPSFVDSHTHLVFAGSREQEFVMRIKGKGYEEIAAEGGGILNSTKKLQETSEEELYKGAKSRLDEVIKMGTGAVEIKSGYGLSYDAELKMLRVIKRLKEISPIPIKATFLGAHAIPMEYRDKREEYVDLVISQMLPDIADEGLADYIDVFCERGFFTQEETAQIFEAGAKYGLTPKVHANELDYSGGIQVGVQHNAISVDHLECTGDAEIEALQNSNTIPTVLPATAFFLNIDYPPARKIIDAGLPLALSTDYNPGSCPSGNMNLVTSMACIKLKLTPEEAINAATVNSAHAMEVEATHGAIAKGHAANLFITKPMSSYAFLPYSFGNNHIDQIILNGKFYEGLG